jgi:hypothetical protein
MPIMQEHRASEARRFGQPHVARHAGAEHLAVEMLDEL